MSSDILFQGGDWRPVPELPKGCESAWTNGRAMIGVYHLGFDKELRSRLDDPKAVRDRYRTVFAKDGIGLIECDVIEVEGARAVRAIGKIVPPAKGATYIGSVAVPLSRESYVLNTLAKESGITGLRETMVMLKISEELDAQGYILHSPSGEPRGKAGNTNNTSSTQPIIWKNPATGATLRWCHDPYEADYDGPCLRNMADAQEHDEKLPDHPLSRVRAALRAVIHDLRFSPELKKRA